MTGESEFNEVFLTDARVADDARIGPLGAGWRIAQTTLANERGMYGSRGFDRAADGTAIATALQLYRNGHRGDSELRARLIRLWVDSQLLGWTARRITSTDPATAVPAPVGKLGFARIQQEGFDLALQLMGEDALNGDGNGGDDRLFDEQDPRHRYLRSRANSIEGGTSEIMKNILALRILGLPADERIDNRVPWSKLRRN
jgi:alkylation response protein AidB-like acyl-CoA dehydrogenase